MTRVLVIEDDEGIQLFLKKLLELKFVFECSQALNGAEALQIMNSKKPQIIFLDLTMPEMDGISFLEEIRKNALYKDIPVIVVTATNDRSILDKCLKLGISDYIVKPLEFQETVERLKKTIYPILKDTKFRSHS